MSKTVLRVVVVVSLMLNAILVSWLVFARPDAVDEQAPPVPAGGEAPASRPVEPGASNAARPDRDAKARATPGSPAIPIPFARAPEADDVPAPAVAPGRSLVARVDAETQADILCEIARRTARDEWRRKKDEITAGLRRSLADAEEQERNARHESDKMARILGLDADDGEVLGQLYREVRLPRIERARQALASNPPDYRTVYQEALALYADEDRLVRELFGPAARERLRLAELDGRTTVLALLASLAGIGWDQVVGW